MTATALYVYRTKSQCEQKAQKELREAGVKAYVPTEKRRWGKSERRVPTARQYVFTGSLKPHDAEHVGQQIPGVAAPHEMRRLYVRSSATQIRHAFAPGDDVSIKRGKYASVPGVVAEIYRGCWYDVRVTLFGRPHVVKLRESDLVRLHPGTK